MGKEKEPKRISIGDLKVGDEIDPDTVIEGYLPIYDADGKIEYLKVAAPASVWAAPQAREEE